MNMSAARTTAERRFEALRRREDRALTEQQEIAEATAAKTARLRAMRLAREAQERNLTQVKTIGRKSRGKRPA